ncbi:DUF4430 domain-containing protein [Rossellomorea vietnamensis]|uniref:DUF4430 domain-containing protein n=1 Tax=Rossellomorea vietnamensis TaxID=218284 RepID=A0A5D4LZN2_9BACI|nr:DUF4430 domain-containing protein [Rossellomorea vietnamensis]TYR94300.1 DUF4430 domain-containing protein [Rossellomorea vietnamensis]
MKRLIFTALMLLMLLLAGCAKDEVGPPAENSGEQSEELAGEDASNDPIVEKEDSETEKEASSDDKNENSGDKKTEEISQKETRSGSNSDQEDTATNTSEQAQQTEQTAKKEQADPSPSESNQTKKSQGETASSSTQKKETENKQEEKSSPPKQEKDSAPPKQEEKTAPPKQDPPKEPEKPKQTVTITMVAPDVKGTILPVTTVEIAEGDTVLSVTQKITKAEGIQLSVRGSGATAYVEGIDNLFEMDEGPLSGWEVFVDGKQLDKSTGIYGIKPGQAIKWHFTKNYTE